MKPWEFVQYNIKGIKATKRVIEQQVVGYEGADQKRQNAYPNKVPLFSAFLRFGTADEQLSANIRAEFIDVLFPIATGKVAKGNKQILLFACVPFEKAAFPYSIVTRDGNILNAVIIQSGVQI